MAISTADLRKILIEFRDKPKSGNTDEIEKILAATIAQIEALNA